MSRASQEPFLLWRHPHAYGAQGNGVSIYLADPEGNQVELKGPSDGKPAPD
jgi:hypothetical protein